MSNSSINTTNKQGFAFAIGAALLFSCKPIIIKWAYTYGIDALSLMLLRMVLALPVYLAIGILLIQKQKRAQQNKLTFRHGLAAAFVGLFGYYLASFLDLKGLELANAQLERIILYAYPTLVVILGAVIFKHKVTKQQLVALALCYAGIICIFLQDLSLQGKQVIQGSLLILLSALSYAVYMLFSKKHIDRLGSLLFTCISMTSATVATIIHTGLVLTITGSSSSGFNSNNWEFSPELMAIVLLLTFAATVVPSFMISEAVKRIGAANAALTGTVGPIMTSIMAVVLLGEVFTLYHGLGMVLVILGVSRLKPKNITTKAEKIV
jgi:drug/metabolite transporter (DMT)-like permease|tara:strand:- start:1394 stop:2362 length:969 start_codon:yes stop_codon:yes gene_type:complete